MSRFLLGAAAAAMLLPLGCRPSGEPAAAAATMDEYIVGTKRISGPYKRVAGASREADRDLGKPDVTVEIQANIAGWTPDEFKVAKDQVVELKLVGTDNGQLPAVTGVREFSGHGFHVYAYDIWVTGLRAGVEKSIKFKASEAGVFPFECSVFCSLDHYKMTGRMIVE